MSFVYNLAINTLVTNGNKITLYGNRVEIHENDIVGGLLFFASKLSLEKNGYIVDIIKDDLVKTTNVSSNTSTSTYELTETTVISSSMSDTKQEVVNELQEIDLNEGDDEVQVPVIVKKERKPRQKRAISNVAIRRIARLSGAKRISKDVYDVTRVAFESMIGEVIDDANIYKEYFDKKTIKSDHVMLALSNKHPTLFKMPQ
jgi:histone H3/H4